MAPRGRWQLEYSIVPMVSLHAGTTEVEPEGGASGGARHGWRPDARWLLGAALLALPVVILAIGAWNYRWMADDGFINLRIVKQILAGHGPVFNAGERVEASTSPLWVALLTAGDLLTPLRIEWVAVLGGMVLTLGGLTLALTGSIRLQRAHHEPCALVAGWRARLRRVASRVAVLDERPRERIDLRVVGRMSVRAGDLVTRR